MRPGKPRSEAALIVDEQLRECPPVLLNSIQLRYPVALVIQLPIGNLAAAAEDRPFFAEGFIDNRRAVGTGIFRQKLNRLPQPVGSAANCNDNRSPTIRLLNSQTSHESLCRDNRR